MSHHSCGCGHSHGGKAENENVQGEKVQDEKIDSGKATDEKAEEEQRKSALESAYMVLGTSEDEVLDVHAIPHFVRHAAILGALASLSPGFSLTIRAGHLPTPLLAQVEQLPGSFTYDVQVNGPEFWLVKITRESA